MSTAPQKAASDSQLNLELLVEQEGDYLYHFALARVRNQETAEELVQDTFLGAARSLDSFRGQSSPRTWLTSILKHKILDYLRKKARNREVQFEDLGGDETNAFFDETGHWATGAVEWSRDPAFKFEQKEVMNVLMSCIDSLPEKLRTVFYLREVDGLSTKELQDTLGISSSNAWVMLYRARMRLRECMEQKWFNSKDLP
ncbi:MAG: sigma-70 family RNA polymerase sigma factor [Bdellovibrionales bacterium]|nr:sigma-70 family RNA polymerase sigma factor [Bdellovibrionales bacterium]